MPRVQAWIPSSAQEARIWTGDISCQCCPELTAADKLTGSLLLTLME